MQKSRHTRRPRVVPVSPPCRPRAGHVAASNWPRRDRRPAHCIELHHNECAV